MLNSTIEKNWTECVISIEVGKYFGLSWFESVEGPHALCMNLGPTRETIMYYLCVFHSVRGGLRSFFSSLTLASYWPWLSDNF